MIYRYGQDGTFRLVSLVDGPLLPISRNSANIQTHNMTYELVYIIPAQHTDAELPGIQAKITGLVEASGAKVKSDKNVGRLKLAYPVKGSKFGHYFMVNFEATAEVLPKINESLRLSNDLARFQISIASKLGKDVGRILSFEEARMRGREERSAQGTRVPGVSVGDSVSVQDAPAKSGMSMDDLDKKLDQILNEKVG